MKDIAKTKKQLIAELDEIRQQRTVEQAAECVRTAAMEMHAADEIRNVVGVLRRELTGLGFSAGHTMVIDYIDESDDEHVYAYYAIPNPRQFGLTWQSKDLWEVSADSVCGLIVWDSAPLRDHIRGCKVMQGVHTGKNEFIQEHLVRVHGMDPGYREHYHCGTYVNSTPFGSFAINILGEEFLAEAQFAVVRPLGEALALGFTRFRDFKRLEEASLNKSNFLASMSHDLRTPMNAIIGYTRILLRRSKDALEPRQYRNLENIETSSQNLLSLINDILDLSKVEAGRIDLKPETVDLKQLTTECIVWVESLVKAEVQLEQQLEDVHPVHTDADRIRRVVMNLLSNALKFTEKGTITTSLKSVDNGVELSVADTGLGIPPEDLPHIFDEFSQVEREGGKKQEGTGLGLAIAKKSVELLGGTIEVESEVGKGTKFTLRLTDYEAK